MDYVAWIVTIIRSIIYEGYKQCYFVGKFKRFNFKCVNHKCIIW